MPHLTRRLVGTTLALVTAAAIGLAWPTPHSTPPAPLPLCATEDSTGPCHWDAQHQGNGLGRSFDVDADGNVTYTDVPR